VKSPIAILDDVTQRLSDIEARLQIVAEQIEGAPEVAGAASLIEAEIKKLLLVTAELAGTASTRTLLGAGTYCRACGTVFPGRLSGDCPNCDTMGRLLPLHDAAEAERHARWRPRFALPDTGRIRVRESALPAEEAVAGVAAGSP
jgi:hypothetical protein